VLRKATLAPEEDTMNEFTEEWYKAILLVNFPEVFSESDRNFGGPLSLKIANGKEALLFEMYIDKEKRASFLDVDGSEIRLRSPLLHSGGLKSSGGISAILETHPAFWLGYLPVLADSVDALKVYQQISTSRDPFYVVLLRKPWYGNETGIPGTRADEKAKKVLSETRRKIAASAMENGVKAHNVVLWRLDDTEHYGELNVGESFYEYVAGLYFRRAGYFVTRYSEKTSCDDIFAYFIPGLAEMMKMAGGCFLEELLIGSPLPVKPVVEKCPANEYDAVVIEAESIAGNFTNGRRQLLSKRGYIKEGGFSRGYVACHEFCPDDPDVGSIGFDDDGKLQVTSPAKVKRHSELKDNAKVFEGVRNLIKALLARRWFYSQHGGELREWLSIPLEQVVERCRSIL